MSFSYTNLTRRLNWAVQAYLADAVLLRAGVERALRPGLRAVHRSRRWRSPPARFAAAPPIAIWPFNRYRRLELFGSVLNYKQEYNDPVLATALAGLSAGAVRHRACCRTAGSCRSARASSRKRRSSASSGRCPATRCGSATRSRPAVGDLTEPPDGRSRPPQVHPARQLGPAGAARTRIQQLGRRRPTSSTSAATPSCAATSTSSSSAARRCS